MALFLIKALGRALAALPESVLAGLCCFFGDILFYLPGKRRRMLLANFHHCFPERTREWRERTARTSCRRLVEMAFFVLASPHLSETQLRKRFEVDQELLDKSTEATEKRQPAVVLVPHLSLMEGLNLLPMLIGEKAPHTAAIYRPLKQKAIDQWVLDTRQRWGMELLSRKAGFLRAQEILRQKGVVVVLFDQNAGDRGILTTFFGRVVSSTELPGLMVEKFKGRVGVIYIDRTGFWRGVVKVEEFERPTSSKDVVFAANEWLERKLSADETVCSTWLWLHDRWRHQDSPERRFRLQNKRNALPETMAYYKWDTLPRKTRFWLRLPNWLGDVVMALPLIRALRQGRPDAEITLLARKQFVPLLQKCGLAERIIGLPEKGDAGYFRFFKDLAYEYPDTHVLFTNSTRGDLEAKAINAPQRFGIERPGKPRKLLSHTWRLPDELNEAEIHQTRLWELFFQHFGLQEALDLNPSFASAFVSTTAHDEQASIGLICATENAPEKRWPVERWRALIEALSEQRFSLFGTPRDIDICNEVAAGFPEERVSNRAGKTSLLNFASELTTCKTIVCNDTGGMHLANMLGVPLVAVFGPTNPIRTGPIFEATHRIVQPPSSPARGGTDITGVTVSMVTEALRECLEGKMQCSKK